MTFDTKKLREKMAIEVEAWPTLAEDGLCFVRQDDLAGALDEIDRLTAEVKMMEGRCMWLVHFMEGMQAATLEQKAEWLAQARKISGGRKQTKGGE